MKFLACLVLLFLPPAAAAQSQLPPCPTDSRVILPRSWHDCFGSRVFSDGAKYVGEFRDGKRHGQGTFTFPSGQKYVGEFRDDKRHGQGTFTFPSGDMYVGEYRDGARNGQGTLTFSDGAKYVGEWRDGKRHGQATFTFPSGRQYVGEWRDDKRQGQGIEYQADGTIGRSGVWTEGELTQSLSLDRDRFPFAGPARVAAPASTARLSTQTTESPPALPFAVSAVNQSSSPAVEKSERDRLAGEVEVERRRRQELEQLLAQAQQAKPAVGSATTAQRLNAHALVIGNGAYPGAMRLPNPTNDARAISEKLRGLGFTVTEVGDANRSRLVQALSQFNRSAATADLTLVFYSGHGVQISGTNYILPIDLDQSDVAQVTIQGISLNSVVEQFMPGPTKIVLLDACRDNPLAMSNTRSVSRGLAPISVSQGTLIAYATKDGQTALDGLPGQKLSPFTTALLEHLSDPDDIAVVLRTVRAKVMNRTNNRQQPWEYGSLTGGALVLSTIKR